MQKYAGKMKKRKENKKTQSITVVRIQYVQLASAAQMAPVAEPYKDTFFCSLAISTSLGYVMTAVPGRDTEGM